MLFRRENCVLAEEGVKVGFSMTCPRLEFQISVNKSLQQETGVIYFVVNQNYDKTALLVGKLVLHYKSEVSSI